MKRILYLHTAVSACVPYMVTSFPWPCTGQFLDCPALLMGVCTTQISVLSVFALQHFLVFDSASEYLHILKHTIYHDENVCNRLLSCGANMCLYCSVQSFFIQPYENFHSNTWKHEHRPLRATFCNGGLVHGGRRATESIQQPRFGARSD
jgi:hypothetical protein